MKKIIKVIAANVVINIFYVLFIMVLAEDRDIGNWIITIGAIYLAWLWAGTVVIATLIIIIRK